jgi:hypothetical protein
VCALHIELMAVRTLFEESHPQVKIVNEDPNHYALGCMAGHNVIAVCLPMACTAQMQLQMWHQI